MFTYKGEDGGGTHTDRLTDSLWPYTQNAEGVKVRGMLLELDTPPREVRIYYPRTVPTKEMV